MLMRSVLLLPGDNPVLLADADILGADGVMVDLDGSVAPSEKDAARILVRHMLCALPLERCALGVRINDLRTGNLWQQDLAAVIQCAPRFVVLAGVGDPDTVRMAGEHISELEARQGLPEGSVRLYLQIGSALAVENAFSLATAHPRVGALMLAGESLAADLCCQRTRAGRELQYPRTRLVNAARAAGCEVYDTTYMNPQDEKGLLEDARSARSMGFTGKVVSMAQHAQAVNEVFSPNRREVETARALLQALERAEACGAPPQGRPVDEAAAARARLLLGLDETAKGGMGR